MTPLEIGMLLHYYVSPADYRDGDISAPAVKDTLDRFLGVEFLKLTGKLDPMYAITRIGKAHVETLCNAPWPEIAQGKDKPE